MNKFIVFLVCNVLLLGYATCIEIDKEWLEDVLEHDEELHDVDDILAVKTSSIKSAPGSEDKRVTVDVSLNDDTKTTRSIIIKSLPSTPHLRKQIEESGLFKTEILAYKNVLSKMERLLIHEHDRGEPLWVRALAYKEYEKIVLEDAEEELEYELADPMKGLVLPKSILALKTMAKFHALSAVANEHYHNLDDFKESLLERNYEELKDFYEVVFNNFAKVIDEKWGPEWTEAAKKIHKVAPDVKERLKKIHEERDTFINVLNLGAPYIKNIYFKYNISDLYVSDKPIAARLSYLQLAFYNSPAYDVQYFINTSPNLDVMTSHRHDLLSEYYHALVKYLHKFDYHGKIPSYEDFIEEIKRTNFAGFVTAVQILPVRFEHTPTIEHQEHNAEMNLKSNTTVLDVSGMYSKEYETIMKVLLKKALHMNLLTDESH